MSSTPPEAKVAAESVVVNLGIPPCPPFPPWFNPFPQRYTNVVVNLGIPPFPPWFNPFPQRYT